MNRIDRENGFAIILVLSILGVVSLIGLSLLYMTQVQLRGANTYIAKLQAKYLAEAGINHVKEVLIFDKQTVAIDSYEDLWRTAFQGEDVDIDNDGLLDSKWFYVKDDNGNDVGRYAVLVQDESARININSAGQHNESGFIEGYSTFEVSLKKFFDNLNLNGQNLTEFILSYRYGVDEKPAIANSDDDGNDYNLENDFLDNDADGVIDEVNEGIDEPQEFNIENPKGDDHPFVVIDELKNIQGISSDIFNNISRFVTVSSKDQEIDANGDMRKNINYMKSDDLIKIMLDKGISEPWQKVVNIVDSVDRNSSRTTIFKYYNLLDSSVSQYEGDWEWVDDHYECNIPSGRGSWGWEDLPFDDGDYYCFIYGLEDEPVGDVEIAGLIQENMYNAGAFIKTESGKVTIENSSFTLSIENNAEFGQTTYFKYIELIPGDLDGSALLFKEFYGVEHVRINEVMVKPKIEIDTTPTSGPGGYWVWQDDLFVNAEPGSGEEGEGTWVFVNIPNGYYYLQLFGMEGEYIGDVEVNGITQSSVRDGNYFTELETINVTSNQLIIRIQNNFEDETCYFKGIILSQQPDTEYVELVNISNNSNDISGWMLETTGQEAITAFIPQGTTILPYSYLVLCVDRDDHTQGIDSNNISFMNTWAIQQSLQLDFFKVLDKDFDFLKDNPIIGENYIILKDADGNIIDKIEYLDNQVADYFSLERADPTEQKDSSGDSEFDYWYLTNNLSGGTPGTVNDNDGMKKDEFSNHDIQEVIVRNYPVSSLLDLSYVSKSDDWQRLGLSDISLIVDSLTIFGMALYPKGNHITGWTEISGEEGGYYSNILQEEGIWQWQNLENGDYFLTIIGEPEEAITVSYKKSNGAWQLLAEGIIPNDEGLAYCGLVSIGKDNPDGTADNILEIKLKNTSNTNVAHFYSLRLDPLRYIYGRVNINTAPTEVLLSLPNIDEQTALTIINNRPFGQKDGIYRGIGDLFLIDIFDNELEKVDKLRTFSNLISVRSDVFKIISRAQVLEQDRVIATQEIKTIIERE